MSSATESINDWWNTSERINTEEASQIYGYAKQTFIRKRCEGKIKLDVYKLGTNNFYRRSQAEKDALAKVKVQRANQPE